MSLTYNKYKKNIDHSWYDSSNIVYSACFDTQDNNTRSLKIVFKGGRTYLYKDVEVVDYVMFRDAESQGKVFNERIKKYECIKQDNTDLNALEQMYLDFCKSDSYSEYVVSIKANSKTGEFKLLINGEPVYEGIEGQVSAVNMLKAMGVKFTIEETEEHNQTKDEFENNNIIN